MATSNTLAEWAISVQHKRQYGKVRLKSGRVIFRNYGRQLKKGGFTVRDVAIDSLTQTNEILNSLTFKWIK